MREARVALQKHLLDAVAIDELIDVGRAPAGAERVVDVADRYAERARLFPVDVQLVLRLIVQAVRPDQADRRILAGDAHQLAARLHQRLMPDVAAVLQLEVEAGRVAELERGRRRERDDDRPAQLVEALVGARRQGEHGILLPRASAQSFRRTNTRPAFCPCPPKLKPLTVNTPLTSAFSSFRK